MFDSKKESADSQSFDIKNNNELVGDENIAIHTMQDDVNALSGIAPQERKLIIVEEKKEDVSFKNKEKPETTQYFNPFLENKSFQGQDKITELDKKKTIPVDRSLIKKEFQNFPKSDSKPRSLSPKVIWTVISIIVIAVFSFGGYYFWTVRNSNLSGIEENKIEEPKESEENNIPEEIIEVKPVFKYSSEKPNYLSIDTEDPSYDNLKGILVKVAAEIKEANISQPIEFIITDNKNNPIAFSIFSTISKIEFSGNLSKSLEDNFSFFICSDSDNTRLAMAIETIDPAKTASLVKSEEGKLISELSSLFLEEASLPKGKILFEDNNYKGIDIRYFNLNANPLSSIDYAFVEKQLVIGTSKNSMFAVIDKILEGKK